MASTNRNTGEGPEEPTGPASAAGTGQDHDEGAGVHMVFAGLTEGGRFFRDSRMGRIFHPGKLSLREVCSKDSLHVSVGAGNRVSVHVDRYSPLAARMQGNRIRYSPVRVLVHNAGVVADLVISTLRRRRGLQRCELECGRVWVDDEGVVEIVEEGCDDVVPHDHGAPTPEGPREGPVVA